VMSYIFLTKVVSVETALIEIIKENKDQYL
jgi:hypothetical protein